MRVYAFDVDETLEVSTGPVQLFDLVQLREHGHIVGLCGRGTARTGTTSARSWGHAASRKTTSCASCGSTFQRMTM
jgi:hypothetical protein